MKKSCLSLVLLGALLPALTACGGYDYTDHISEAREDIFCAETEEKDWGGETSFRNTRGDYFYSQTVEAFPETSVTMRIVWDGGERELTATSVKNENTISVDEALDFALKKEKDTVARMTRNGKFFGEFYVRLLRRNTNYYYVGIVDTDGKTISLLLNSETGEVLARREN